MKKLLPILGLSLSPIALTAVACQYNVATDVVTVEWSTSRGVFYIPYYEQYKEDKKSTKIKKDEIISTYVKASNNVLNLFANDIVYSMFRIEERDVHTAKVTASKFDSNTNRLSFKVELKYSAGSKVRPNRWATYEIENVEYEVDETYDPGKIMLSPKGLDGSILDMEGWAVKVYGSQEQLSFNYSIDPSSTKAEFDEFAAAVNPRVICLTPYYYQGVQIEK